MEGMDMNSFHRAFKGSRVLVTGHTGFKGSWLTSWLLELGAEVVGISQDIPTSPSMFEELGLEKRIDHRIADLREFEEVKRIITTFAPHYVFHLAAQAIVSKSYQNPVDTITSNVIGTTNVLEALRLWNEACSVVIVTSDKCYENVEWIWGYKETDHIGGKDIYSASKGAAEVVFHGYFESFFNRPESRIKIASARAGNVIGGGDWAKDRLVVDCVTSWSENKIVEIRSPTATRPWQHVLEPLSGYLTLACNLKTNPLVNGESYNFGPKMQMDKTVLDVMKELSKAMGINEQDKAFRVTNNLPFKEAGLLRLNCDKALHHLRWEATLDHTQCIAYVGNWYKAFYDQDQNMYNFTKSQLLNYSQAAIKQNLIWTQ